MKIIDIIKTATSFLGLSNELDILETATPETENEVLENAEIKKLFHLVKFSIQELCTNYVPVSKIENVEVSNLKYPLSNLSNYIRLQNVYLNEVAVPFKVINRCLTMEHDGIYQVKYSTYPEITSLYEDVKFLAQMGIDVVMFGLCAYYCLNKGMFEDFKSYHDNYIEKAESLKDLKCFVLPQRRWEWKQKNTLK